MNISQEEAMKIIAGNEPLATVCRYLVSSEFAPAPKESVQSGEVIIGELNRLEKAIYSARHEFAERGYQVARISLADMFFLNTIKETYEVLDALLWITIRNRLAETRTTRFGLRKDFMIVRLPPKSSSTTSNPKDWALPLIVSDPEDQ
jgi:hypothetical protein